MAIPFFCVLEGGGQFFNDMLKGNGAIATDTLFISITSLYDKMKRRTRSAIEIKKSFSDFSDKILEIRSFFLAGMVGFRCFLSDEMAFSSLWF